MPLKVSDASSPAVVMLTCTEDPPGVIVPVTVAAAACALLTPVSSRVSTLKVSGATRNIGRC